MCSREKDFGEGRTRTLTTERILEVRANTSGSDISLASFSDSCVDLTEVAGRHGIEIADLRCHEQQDGILFLRQVVIGFGTFIAL